MKTQHMTTTRRYWLATTRGLLLAAATLAAACGDGATAEIPSAGPSVSAPVVVSFKAESLADPSQVGEAIAIEAGTGVTLSWEVTGADKVELASSGGTVAAHEVKAKGSEAVAALSMDEAFTLTASITDPATSEVLTTKRDVRVTVVVAKPSAAILEFAGDPAQIEAGASTKLCFKVVPKDAVVKVTEKETGTEIQLESAVPAEPTSEDVELLSTVDASVPADEPVDAMSAMTKLSLAATLTAEEVPATETPTETPVTEPTVEPTDPTVIPGVPGSPEISEPVVEAPAPEETPAEDEATDETSTTGSYSDADIYSGCTIALTPAPGEHIYVLTVTDAKGLVATQETTITVTSELSVDLRVNDKSAETLDGKGKVTLSWTVTPADAVLSLDPAIEGCDVAALTVDGKGRCEVEVAETKTITLKATDKAGQEKLARIEVTVEAKRARVLTLAPVTVEGATPPSPDAVLDVFAGESLSVNVGGDAGSVRLRGPADFAGPESVVGGTLTFQPTISGGYYVEATGEDVAAGEAPKSNPVNVSVRTWGEAYDKAVTWMGVGVNPTTHAIMFGAETKFSADSTAVKIARHTEDDEWLVASVDLGKELAGEASGGVKINPKGFSLFGSAFSVNAFAFDPKKDDGKRAYAAASGAILYSGDAGGAWKLLAPFPVIDQNGSLGTNVAEHEGCKGRRQVGLPGNVGPFVNVMQVCDVIVDYESNGPDRLIAATDHGVFYVDDVDRYRSNRNDPATGWQGVLREGHNLQPGKTLFGIVANDIELVRINEQAFLLAATRHGVYINRQRGEVNSWEDFNGGEMGSFDLMTFKGDAEEVYAITVDTVTREIFAGTKSGKLLRRSTDMADAWTTVSTGEPVYSLALDVSNGALLLGDANGVYISRDRGVTSVPISTSMRLKEGKGTIYSLAIGTDSYVAATSQGVYVSHANKPVSFEPVVPEETPVEAPVAPETVAPEAPVVPAPPAAPETPATAAKAAAMLL